MWIKKSVTSAWDFLTVVLVVILFKLQGLISLTFEIQDKLLEKDIDIAVNFENVRCGYITVNSTESGTHSLFKGLLVG